MISVLISLYLLQYSTQLDYEITAMAVVFMAYSFYVHGTWLENRPNALRQELFRMISLIVLIQFVHVHILLKTSITVYAALSLLALYLYKDGVFLTNNQTIQNDNKSQVKSHPTA